MINEQDEKTEQELYDEALCQEYEELMDGRLEREDAVVLKGYW